MLFRAFLRWVVPKDRKRSSNGSPGFDEFLEANVAIPTSWASTVLLKVVHSGKWVVFRRVSEIEWVSTKTGQRDEGRAL
jgi:hypothetical protein